MKLKKAIEVGAAEVSINLFILTDLNNSRDITDAREALNICVKDMTAILDKLEKATPK